MPMSKNDTNDQRQLQYEEQWKTHFYPAWVGRWRDTLATVEQFVDHDQFLTVVDRTNLFRSCEGTPDTITDREAVLAIAYLVIKEERPWFQMKALTDRADVSLVHFTDAIKYATIEAYHPEITTPEEFLDAMDWKLTDENYEKVDRVLRGIPEEFRDTGNEYGFYSMLNSQEIVAAAIYLALDVSVDDVVYDYLGNSENRSDLRPEAVKDTISSIQDHDDFYLPPTREEKLNALEEAHSTELRNLNISVGAYQLAIRMENADSWDDVETHDLWLPVSGYLQELRESDLVEGREVVNSVFK